MQRRVQGEGTGASSLVWGIGGRRGFLKALKAHRKQPLLIIWDGARPHRAAMVREYLDSLEGHIHMTFLPPYSRAQPH
ncbi:protein of unknown function (plasmid) [Cupriavidus taiwanensis]|uniref:Tc1-like transposase DDE domain-containing protein n=1 Tax=Cupriavidus taiwanensis TaxID=164546 RepID=A0A7Z7JGI1_9BURK|nr:hypothetical protein CBM2597_U50019 [Cupriavidus taiwanensis]SOZ97263.1 hypothetical protein CBM2598_U50019 [Cupriavidus taiwanensis]SPC26153.1 hypothetical protein CBM2594_U60019 [Cupriavidus taiwanensis]SPD37713.1 protein of unknown function [Cupriavidus taiwanensis]